MTKKSTAAIAVATATLAAALTGSLLPEENAVHYSSDYETLQDMFDTCPQDGRRGGGKYVIEGGKHIQTETLVVNCAAATIEGMGSGHEQWGSSNIYCRGFSPCVRFQGNQIKARDFRIIHSNPPAGGIGLLATFGFGQDDKSPSGGTLSNVLLIANHYQPDAVGIKIERSVSYTLFDVRIDEFGTGLWLNSDQGGGAVVVMGGNIRAQGGVGILIDGSNESRNVDLIGVTVQGQNRPVVFQATRNSILTITGGYFGDYASPPGPLLTVKGPGIVTLLGGTWNRSATASVMLRAVGSHAGMPKLTLLGPRYTGSIRLGNGVSCVSVPHIDKCDQ